MDGYYVVGDKFSKWEEFKVDQGVLNGDYIVFHSNGQIFTHSTYLDGKLHGEEKVNYLSGKLKELNNYSHGVWYGKSIEYFETGQILSESIIENEKVVESISFNNIGQIFSQIFIKEGRSISQTIRNGKLISEQISSNYDNFEAMKFYNEDGSLAIYFKMLDEDDKSYLVELDENNNEIKRIDIKANPQELLKYQKYLSGF